jgi:precorrin-3B synthase
MNGADPSSLVKGWCPGAVRPMQSGDGLIVRLRVSGGEVALPLAARIAEWSGRWSNGQIDLSNRANLQLRGISPRHLPELWGALRDFGLLDDSGAGEAVRNVISSPLTGLDPTAVMDVRPVARALAHRLATDTVLHDLPNKFGFAVDDGGLMSLLETPTDIRFVARRTIDGPVFDIHLAGARLGPCRPGALMDIAAVLGRVFLRLRIGQEARIRRMRDLVSAFGAETIAREAGLPYAPTPATARPAPDFIGVHTLGSAAFIGLGLPFGRITAEDLAALASAAKASGAQSLRLTPWRAILVPVPTVRDASALAAGLSGSFIPAAGDPGLRVAACVGAPSCPRATTPVRDVAAGLAKIVGSAAGSGIFLHLSGCEKGCAHPTPAPVTLLARNDHYDLIRDGIASDAPAMRNLTLEQVSHIVGELRSP